MKYACREQNYHWFVDDYLNPYTTPEGMPYQWTRGRQLGGRTLMWGRLMLASGQERLQAQELGRLRRGLADFL